MKILVAGGAGFIGSHLVAALVKPGHTVRMLDALIAPVHGANAEWLARPPGAAEKFQKELVRWARTQTADDRVEQATAELAARGLAH